MRINGIRGRWVQFQQVRHRNHALDLVQPAATHRIPGMRAFFTGVRHALECLRRGQIRIQPFNLGPWHHQGGQGPVVQMKHIAHHLMLVRFNQAGVHALLQAGRYFLDRDTAALRFIDAQQFQHALRAQGQQPDERFGQLRQPGHGPGNPARHAFRKHLADALGHQFAKNDGGEGDGRHHQRRGRDRRGRLAQAQARQPVGHRPAEGRLAHDAVEHADGGDAHLHRGQKLGGPLHQAQRGTGTGISAFFQRGQPGLATGRHGKLGHGEHAVEQGQKNDQDKVHAEQRLVENSAPWHST